MFKLKSLPLVGTLIQVAEFVVGVGVAASGSVEPTYTPSTPDPLDPEPLDAAALLQKEREAHEQTKAALTASEAARRDAEALVETRDWSVERALEVALARWEEALREVTGFPEAIVAPSGTVQFDAIEPLLEQGSALVTRAIQRAAALHRAVDRDKTGLGAALARVVEEAQGRYWIAEGRGNYAWDDDAYRREAGEGYRAIVAVAKQALASSGDLATWAIRGEPLGAEPEKLTVAEAVAIFLADGAQRAALIESRWDQIREASGLPSHALLDTGLQAAFDVAIVEALQAIQHRAAPTTGQREAKREEVPRVSS